MDESIRILIVEDLLTDAELAEREIRRALKSCVFQRVDTREDYLTALETFQPDLIISDYRMPRFEGLTALKLALTRAPDTPVIILTTAINEDTAVECMKAGAADYVIKEHIKRLGQAAIHVLGEKKMRAERRRAEKALRESEERYRTLMHTLPDFIAVTDTTGNISFASPATLQFYGYHTPDEVIGKNIFSWIHPDCHAQARIDMEAVVAGGTFRNKEYRLLRKDGSVFFGEISASCLKDTRGSTIGIIIIVRDITTRKQAEEEKARLEAQLIQAQKLEALGTLAGGIAHDFNNILGAILGYAELSRLSIPETDELYAYQTQIYTAGMRAKELVQQITTVTRQQEHVKAPVEVYLIVKEVIRLIRKIVPATIEIRHFVDQAAGTVMADPARLHQVLMNLCTNAVHAMRDNDTGILEIHLDACEVDDELARKVERLHTGKYVRLQVTDTGHGMDSATVERIFDPYFTTKAPGEGTGLGLAVVNGIISAYGGAIHVQSKIGKGSSFQIFIPRIESPKLEEKFKDLNQADPQLGGTERILLIDDELQLVHVEESLLKHLGYQVTAVNSGAEALKIFMARPHDFDLILTDQTMPDVTGVGLAEEILSKRPDIPIVLCTGYSDKVDPETVERIGICELLSKPMSIGPLSIALRRAIDKKKGERSRMA